MSNLSSRLPRGRARWVLVLLVALLVAAGTTIIATRGGASRRGAVGKVAAADPARMFSARLSIPVEYRSCRVIAPKADETIPRTSCGPDDGRLDELEDLAAAGGGSSPDSLQAAALLAMMREDSTGERLDDAIARLSKALRLARRPVPILVDLSAAYLSRAERKQYPRDLMEGLEYALQALAEDSLDSAARFNKALAAQLLGLDEQAVLAWTAYLRIDSTSPWADEAREHLRELPRPPAVRLPGPATPEAEVRAFAVSHRQEARLYGWDVVLGRWGSGLLAGDTAKAAAELQLAERLGTELEARGGDASLADGVRAIRAARDDPAAIRELAEAHRAYAGGQVHYGHTLEFPAAADSFMRAASVGQHSPVLALSAEAFEAGISIYRENFDQAQAAFDSLLPRIDSVRYPALYARALWMRGVGPLRSGGYAAVRERLQASANLFERAKETEFASAMWWMDGEAAYKRGDTLAAYGRIHRGLTSLRRYRSSIWLSSALMVLANCATVDGMPRAAAVVQDENFTAALGTDQPLVKAEALLERVRLEAGASRWTEATRALERADSFVKEIRAPVPARDMREREHYYRALVATDSASLAGLDSAVANFQKNPIWLLPALLRRADVRLAQGKLASATGDLDTATARIRRLSQPLREAWLRAAVMEQARRSFDRLVMVHLGENHQNEALLALERGRVSFAPVSATPTVPTGVPAMPPGQVAVEYALIGDTLLTWTIRGGEVALVRDTVDRAELLRRIESAVSKLESPSRAASAQPDLEWLYEVLMRPIESRLGAPETPLAIVADGEIAGVPFSVLRDAARGRYLVEDHPLRIAPTLADAARPTPPVDATALSVLLVANPAFDLDQYPEFDRLENAQAEAEAIQALYQHQRSVLISGTAATPAALLEAAPRAGVIHYAGHALFDDARPERSVLVLVGADTTGRLTAEAVNALRLPGVRLVVLASCRTSRSREGRSGGLAGFSGALLVAGAGGVVGSLWEANDRTTQPFMIEFHRAYRQSGDPAAALRTAQLAMLRHPRPELHSPSVWGGFRYIGR